MDKFRAPGRRPTDFVLRSLIFFGSHRGTCFLSLYLGLELGNDSQIFGKLVKPYDFVGDSYIFGKLLDPYII
jgi:hypothetical protein